MVICIKLTLILTLEISNVILHELHISIWKFPWSSCITQSLDGENFHGHFRLTPDSAFRNFRRHLYQPKFWRWKIPSSFLINCTEMLTLEISMVVCITSRKFWSWKFPWLFWINSKFWRWKFTSPICVSVIRCSANRRLFASLKQKINPSSSIWKYFRCFFTFLTWIFFLAINEIIPEFLAKSFMQKNMFVSKTCHLSVHLQRTGNFGVASWQFCHSILNVGLSKIAYIEPFLYKRTSLVIHAWQCKT